MKAGILFWDINARGSGSVPVAVSIIECVRRLGLRAILLCGKKLDRIRLAKNFGVSIQLDGEVVLPVWFHVGGALKYRTYFDFLLPILAKPICDIIVNPYTNDLLPWVDVTYINAPRPLLLEQKSRDQKFWGCYYKPYQVIEQKLGFRSNKLVLANSYFTANAIRKQTGLNPIVIYPPVNVKEIITNSKSNFIKENMVLTISRFSPEKRLEQIPLIAREINARFVILGTVNNAASYYGVCKLVKKYGLEDKVAIIVNHPNNHRIKMELLRKAKVLFHTSLFEPFGISIVEGMAAGCIPVAHDSGGPREFVPESCRYKDIEEATQKIKEALDSWSPSVANHMKSISYRFRKERFEADFSKIFALYLKNRDSANWLHERDNSLFK